jgi:hypothetical protein
MTNLNKLIERRQGEIEGEIIEELEKCLDAYKELNGVESIHYKNRLLNIVANEINTIGKNARRQTLKDVLAGLPEEEDGETPFGSQELHETEVAWNKALQTVRAQIEGLLSKIDTNSQDS